jgi:tetrahydromethanopterin S-methyltransferase subunit G
MWKARQSLNIESVLHKLYAIINKRGLVVQRELDEAKEMLSIITPIYDDLRDINMRLDSIEKKMSVTNNNNNNNNNNNLQDIRARLDSIEKK